MNVAFFGTSDRSIPLLEALKNSEFDLVLCVTKADKTVGRKREIKPTAVKTWCEDNGVQVVTIERFDADMTAQIKSLLSEKDIELCVVADFSFMIPEELSEFPKHKFVNIHFSLLPRYRGAGPVQAAILNGDEKTGITYLLIVKKLDAGPMLFKSEHQLSGNETSDSLYKTLFEKAAGELPEVLEKYVSGTLVPTPQNEEEATYTYSKSHPKHTLIFKEDAKIDWSAPHESIERAVRAYIPWPVAWTTLGELNSSYCAIKPVKDLNLKVKIFETGLDDSGKLLIKRLQVEGKSIVSWEEFKNGYADTV